MSTLTPGDIVPNFSTQDQDGNPVSLSDFARTPVVLFFYPRADTPGCTVEACSFRDAIDDLKAAGVTLLGISRDTVKAQKKFAEKFHLKYPLLADPDEKICDTFGVIQPKNMYGKLVKGVARTTYLIAPADAEGHQRIQHIWEQGKTRRPRRRGPHLPQLHQIEPQKQVPHVSPLRQQRESNPGTILLEGSDEVGTSPYGSNPGNMGPVPTPWPRPLLNRPCSPPTSPPAPSTLAASAGLALYGALSDESQLFGPSLVSPPNPGQLALTFDDGPNPRITPQLLELLARHQARATFFVIGQYAQREPALLREIAAAGHTIGNHTQHHLWLARHPAPHHPGRTHRLQPHPRRPSRRSRSELFRPPHGARRPAVFRAARKLGLQVVLWNLMVGDWKPRTPEDLARRIESAASPPTGAAAGAPTSSSTTAASTTHAPTAPPPSTPSNFCSSNFPRQPASSHRRNGHDSRPQSERFFTQIAAPGMRQSRGRRPTIRSSE